MEWRAKPNPAIWLVALLGWGIPALDGWLLWMVLRRPLDIVTFWIGAWSVVSLLVAALCVCWLFVQGRLRYHLNRNEFIVRSPLMEHRAPITAITAIAPRDASHVVTRFRGLHLLGYRIGAGEIAAIGPAWFCATRPGPWQWLVTTPALAYVITPTDPASLVAAYTERLALGANRQVTQGHTAASFLSWDWWHDKLALGALGLASWLNVVLFAHVSGHHSAGPVPLVRWADVLRWPLIGLAILLVNLVFGVLLYRRHRVAAHLLFVAAMLVQVLLARVAFAAMPATPESRLAYQIAAGICLSALIAAVGYRKQALSASGVLGALLVGTVIFGFGGWIWGMLLIAFFASSSALSAYRRSVKETLADKFAKGARRDLGQALANGGLGALLALFSYLWPHPLWFPAFLGVMATVNADTWATEIGVLSKRAPRLISTWKKVAVGTSGGVSLLGLGAALGGGAFIGLLAIVFAALDTLARRGTWAGPAAIWLPLTGVGAGLVGSLVDSLLGATIQGMYYCDACQKETERALHSCGNPTRPLRGWQRLDNDWVNLLSSAAGGALAAATAHWLW